MQGDRQRDAGNFAALKCFFCELPASSAQRRQRRVRGGRRAEAEALCPSCSVTRGLRLISSRSRKNGEKGSETTDRKGFPPPPPLPFLRLKRMPASLPFHRGKQLFIASEQGPTWLASDAIKAHQHFQIWDVNRTSLMSAFGCNFCQTQSCSFFFFFSKRSLTTKGLAVKGLISRLPPC